MKDIYERLVDDIYRIALGTHKESQLTKMITGVVKSVNPLSICIDEDSTQRTITQEFLTLSSTCKRREIPNTHYHNYDGGQTSSEVTGSGSRIQLWGDLQVGEKVLLLRVNNGQMYWVMDRA